MQNKHIMTIGLIAVAATTTLVMFESSQRQPITEQAQAWELRPVHEVLAGVSYDNNLLSDRLEVLDTTLLGPRQVPIYRARQAGTVQALAVQVHSREGYGGAMDLLVAIDRQGAVVGVHALKHQETPGIGEQCTDPANQWLVQQFSGHSLDTRPRERWASSVDGGAFDQLTGATVTSRAITKAVRNALLYTQAHRSRLFEQADSANLGEHNANAGARAHVGERAHGSADAGGHR